MSQGRRDRPIHPFRN